MRIKRYILPCTAFLSCMLVLTVRVDAMSGNAKSTNGEVSRRLDRATGAQADVTGLLAFDTSAQPGSLLKGGDGGGFPGLPGGKGGASGASNSASDRNSAETAGHTSEDTALISYCVSFIQNRGRAAPDRFTPADCANYVASLVHGAPGRSDLPTASVPGIHGENGLPGDGLNGGIGGRGGTQGTGPGGGGGGRGGAGIGQTGRGGAGGAGGDSD